MISLSYSRISLADIAQKLQLDSPEDAEFIVAKVGLSRGRGCRLPASFQGMGWAEVGQGGVWIEQWPPFRGASLAGSSQRVCV